MERDVLSMRQMMVLLAVALLTPAADLLPTLTARWTGSGGWLAVLGTLPLLLVALWAGGGFWRKGGPKAALGTFAGAILIIIYMVWILLTLALTARLCGARLTSIYGAGPAFGCAAALMIVGLWMGRGKTAAFARAGEVFYLALAVVLGGILLLAAFKVEWGNLRPSTGSWAAVPGSAAAAAGLLLNLAPAAVLGKRVTDRPRNSRRAVGWTVAFCIAATLLVGAVIGCVGSRLAARLGSPFLIMVQGLGIKGAFQRTEALIAALLTLSDLTLSGLLLHAWRELAGELRPGRWCRWSVLPAAAAALALGWLLFPEEVDIARWAAAPAPLAGLILGLAVPFFVRLILELRGRRK